jgi:hypothetical protein
VPFSLFTVFIPRSAEKSKKKFISSIVLYLSEPQIFVSITLLSLCLSWLRLVAGSIHVISFSILLHALFVPLTDSTFSNNKPIQHIN